MLKKYKSNWHTCWNDYKLKKKYNILNKNTNIKLKKVIDKILFMQDKYKLYLCKMITTYVYAIGIQN